MIARAATFLGMLQVMFTEFLMKECIFLRDIKYVRDLLNNNGIVLLVVVKTDSSLKKMTSLKIEMKIYILN